MISYEEAAKRMRTVATKKGNIIKVSKELWLTIAKMLEKASEIEKGNLTQHRLSFSNSPLTPEELRKMDGEPVYVVHKDPQYTRWYIWDNKSVDEIHDGLEGYGLFWFAYRCKPGN